MKAAKASSDQAERTKLYEEAQVIFKREAPWATIDHSVGFTPISKKVTASSWTRLASTASKASISPISVLETRPPAGPLPAVGATWPPDHLGRSECPLYSWTPRGPHPDLPWRVPDRLLLHPPASGRSGHAHVGRAGDVGRTPCGDHARSRPRQADVCAVSRLSRLGGSGRPRHLDRHQAPRAAGFPALFPATLELSLCAIILAVALGVPAGVFAAVKRGTWFDQSVMGVALVGYSMPIFCGACC